MRGDLPVRQRGFQEVDTIALMRPITKEQILQQVWDYDFTPESTVVETYISYLRRKLDKLGPPLIVTRRGIGYGLRAN